MKPIIHFAWFTLAVMALIARARIETEWVAVDETDHFTLLAAQGAEAALPRLAEELEANYTRIISDLQVVPKEKYPVHIFSNIETFHWENGQPDVSATHVGTVPGTDIWSAGSSFCCSSSGRAGTG
jgi:hypothetical protein